MFLYALTRHYSHKINNVGPVVSSMHVYGSHLSKQNDIQINSIFNLVEFVHA